jgi:hypothetical protein
MYGWHKLTKCYYDVNFIIFIFNLEYNDEDKTPVKINDCPTWSGQGKGSNGMSRKYRVKVSMNNFTDVTDTELHHFHILKSV